MTLPAWQGPGAGWESWPGPAPPVASTLGQVHGVGGGEGWEARGGGQWQGLSSNPSACGSSPSCPSSLSVLFLFQVTSSPTQHRPSSRRGGGQAGGVDGSVAHLTSAGPTGVTGKPPSASLGDPSPAAPPSPQAISPPLRLRHTAPPPSAPARPLTALHPCPAAPQEALQLRGGWEGGIGEAQNRQTQTDGRTHTKRGWGGWVRWGLMISLPGTPAPSPRGDAEPRGGGNRNVTHTHTHTHSTMAVLDTSHTPRSWGEGLAPLPPLQPLLSCPALGSAGQP